MMIDETSSWRDPSGFVFQSSGRIYRAVVPEAVEKLRQLLDSPWFQARTDDGSFPRSRWLREGPLSCPRADKYVWLEHDALGFPCYPHEITALQLYDAAKLTLNIAHEALQHGWQLKDASAWNVLFDNGRPVFCDILSFEPTDESGIWAAYAQFCRHFVIPLVLYKELSLQPAELFLTNRDGVTPERARPMLKGLSAMRQPALETITLPLLFAKQGKAAIAAAVRRSSKPVTRELAFFLLNHTLNRLEKNLDAVKPKTERISSVWVDYEATRDHYNKADLAAKHSFVLMAFDEFPCQTVLDLGCNAGEFSSVAATLGKKIVAADFDDGALTSLYAKLRKRPANISPLLLDIGRPTPAVGWMNREVQSFLGRAKGKFDCVMALGLIHHLLLTERVPLLLILQLMLELEPKVLIIEWIEPNDPCFVELVGFNEENHKLFSGHDFETAFGKFYRLVRKQRLPSRHTRILYQWVRMSATSGPAFS